MHRNPYWLFFIIAITLAVIGYSGYTAFKLYQYTQLTYQVPTSQLEWSVMPLEEDKFTLQAHYHYCFQKSCYEGKTNWQEQYLNAWTAQEAIQRLSTKPWKVWIDPTAPHVSNLQKIFPFKQVIYTILLWLLLIYFIELGRYIAKYYK